jgi:hypothetical protein
MKRLVSTALAVALLLSLGALAVLARGGGDILTPADTVVAAAVQPQKAAAPDAPVANITGYTWIALPLNTFPAGSTAATLATHIQNNSSSAVTVETISKWNPVAQSIDSYDYQYDFGDFPISNQSAYRVGWTAANSAASITWSLVGDVPGIGSYSYTLLDTDDTDYNWIMLPLDRSSMTLASALAADIEAHASPAVTVLTVSKWNSEAQSWDSYDHQYNFGDFNVQFGYPYRVEVDVTGGTSATWQ